MLFVAMLLIMAGSSVALYLSGWVGTSALLAVSTLIVMCCAPE
jgi:hypothetical protein